MTKLRLLFEQARSIDECLAYVKRWCQWAQAGFEQVDLHVSQLVFLGAGLFCLCVAQYLV